MDHSIQLLSENLFNMLRGAIMMMFIIMCVSLYPKRKENSILNSLFWLFAIMPVLLFITFGFMIEELKNDERFYIFSTLTNMCLIPLIGSFLLNIIMPKYVNIHRKFLMLSPTIIFAIIYAITYSRLMLTLSYIYTAIVAAVVFFLIVFISIRYDRYLKNNFSNIDNKTVGWVRVVIYIFAAWYLIWNLMVKQDNRWLDSAYYLFLIIIWIFIYKYSIKHVTIYQPEEVFPSQEQEEVGSLQTSSLSSKLGNTLEAYMDQSLPWLNPSLTLGDLAAALNTNRTYLSEHFHKTLGTTFYDYINGYRLKYACEILLSEPDLSVPQIGEKAGFKSLSTFRRAFKKHIGCTPAKYCKQKINY